jgi:hypothetical protein
MQVNIYTKLLEKVSVDLDVMDHTPALERCAKYKKTTGQYNTYLWNLRKSMIQLEESIIQYSN